MKREILYLIAILGGCGALDTDCEHFDERGRKTLLSQQFMLKSVPDKSTNIQCHEIYSQDTARYFAFSADSKGIDIFIEENFPTLDVTRIDRSGEMLIDIGVDLDWWVDDRSKIDYYYRSNRKDSKTFELYISRGRSRDRIWGSIIERR